MNFTRDPIIETVITPREGCKLVVRSSKGANQEDYFVDALEVVSFGHSFFFRSLERPKSFLVPVTDYEIFESKEPRMALKNVSSERSIKIGGGRESAPPRNHRDSRDEEGEEGNYERSASTPSADRKPGGRDNKQRRRGRRGGRDRHEGGAPQNEESEIAQQREMHHQQEGSEEGVEDSFVKKNGSEEAPKEKATSFISKLFPPPTMLIKETLSRYKQVDPAPEDLLPNESKDPISVEDHGSFEETDSEASSPEIREPFNEEE